ncbi:sporulation protein YqfD [Clostridia bacterium]|nr:sporulation protein YqfD [Clostridia bacterium]
MRFMSYVAVRAAGASLERFLNLAARHGAKLWDIRRGGGCIYFMTTPKGYKELRVCARKSNVKIHIESKHGIRFFLYRHRKRKVLAGGAVFFICVLYYLSSFIWLVKVYGNERIETEQIVKFFSEQNLRVGGTKLLVHKKDAEKLFLTEFSDAAWVNVNIRGTRADIYIAENLPKRETAGEDTPCNITAKRDGIITSIVTSAGTPLKKEGDAVLAGEILVSGEILVTSEEVGERFYYTRAAAEVSAKTYYEFDFTVPYEYEERVYTGHEKKYYRLLAFDKNIQIFAPKIKYRNYTKITEREQLKLSEDYPLPIIFVKETYREFAKHSEKYSASQTLERAGQILTEKIIMDFDFEVDIMDKTIQTEERADGLFVRAYITAVEPIGVVSSLE